jgi:hypothetical protein
MVRQRLSRRDHDTTARKQKRLKEVGMQCICLWRLSLIEPKSGKRREETANAPVGNGMSASEALIGDL